MQYVLATSTVAKTLPGMTPLKLVYFLMSKSYKVEQKKPTGRYSLPLEIVVYPISIQPQVPSKFHLLS